MAGQKVFCFVGETKVIIAILELIEKATQILSFQKKTLFLHSISAIMRINTIIIRRLDSFIKKNIIKEQYPLLTSFSLKQRKRDGAIGVVYMLHHITKKNPNGIPTNEDLKVSPDFLEMMILKYQKHGFDFLSLDQLYAISSSGIKPKCPFVAFTIDDGYLDNYTEALPIFEKYEVPFAVFVATDFIDKKAILWWDSIEDLLLTHGKVVTGDGCCYPSSTYQERWDSFRYLRERILNLNQNRLEEELNILFSNYNIDWLEPIRQQGMSWEQVKVLAKHPLCTIGGHTVSHPSLSILPTELAKCEIQEGIEKLEQSISQPVHYFAFPYGTPNEVGEREFRIVSDLGVKLAFMAHQGCITIDNVAEMTHLPRVYFRES